jgi:hypothetical protein
VTCLEAAPPPSPPIPALAAVPFLLIFLLFFFRFFLFLMVRVVQVVHLKKNRSLLSPYVAMGTAEVKGEDNEPKGAVYLFEVAHLEVRAGCPCVEPLFALKSPRTCLLQHPRFFSRLNRRRAARKQPRRRAVPPEATVRACAAALLLTVGWPAVTCACALVTRAWLQVLERQRPLLQALEESSQRHHGLRRLSGAGAGALPPPPCVEIMCCTPCVV